MITPFLGIPKEEQLCNEELQMEGVSNDKAEPEPTVPISKICTMSVAAEESKMKKQ